MDKGIYEGEKVTIVHKHKADYSIDPFAGSMNIRTVSSILKRRAYIFTCSYKTAWEQWMLKEEKQGFTYEEVTNYIAK